jgi:hypothetical protein
MTAPKTSPPTRGSTEISGVEMRFFLDDPIPVRGDGAPGDLYTGSGYTWPGHPDHWTAFKLRARPPQANWWSPSKPLPVWGGAGVFDPHWARERWRLAEPEVIHWWIRNYPGSRPSRWWIWSAPVEPTEGEDQLAYLRKHRLLERVEVELLAARS